MSSLPLQNPDVSWYNFFFNHPIPVSSDRQQEIFQILKKEYEDFRNSEPKPVISQERHDELNAWYHGDGQTILTSLFKNLWEKLFVLSSEAMPAHDARHAIFRVPASSLEFVHSENVTGWQRIGVLGAMCHDWGRWSEERIWGGPQESSAHSRMSFLLTREFLLDYDLPQEIRWHILHAVAVHTKGANEDAPMPTKLTVAADREQLWGPEFVLRMCHHLRDSGCARIYPEYEGDKGDIRTKLLYIYINRFMGPLHSRNDHLAVLRGRLLQFLYLSGDTEFQKNILTFGEEHKSWLPMDYKKLIDEANSFYTNVTSPSEALGILLTARHVAPNAEFLADALKRVDESPQELHQSLAKALMFNQFARLKEDARILTKLEYLTHTFKKDAFLSVLTSTLLKNI